MFLWLVMTLKENGVNILPGCVNWCASHPVSVRKGSRHVSEGGCSSVIKQQCPDFVVAPTIQKVSVGCTGQLKQWESDIRRILSRFPRVNSHLVRNSRVHRRPHIYLCDEVGWKQRSDKIPDVVQAPFAREIMQPAIDDTNKTWNSGYP